MKIISLALLFFPFLSLAQNNLLDEIEKDSVPVFTEAAFKGLKIVNFESTKLIGKKQFTFVVAHRFGSIENGFDTFFGLDDAVTRLQFIYGLSDGINIGVSRSSYQKVFDASIKYRLIRQQKNGFPVTVVGYNSILVNTGLKKENLPKLEFEHQLGFTTQLLISRKFGPKLSLELIPTYFHNNYVLLEEQNNSQFALGMGGRYKLGKRWSVNIDYGLHLNRASNSPFKNPLSIGIDLETGGHVFQMHFTNSQPMLENYFLSHATGDWGEGQIYFGFNLSRYF
ncbi:MAG TPA: DUF5777 family beta-barrel protein [Flavobacteriaceae bacterium]|nr:DUF5777 family beta-barrel protein [Flavobacteriaceae bacterium]